MKLVHLISVAMVAGWVLPAQAKSQLALDEGVLVSEQSGVSNQVDTMLKLAQQQVTALQRAMAEHVLRHPPSAPGWPCGASQERLVMDAMRTVALALVDKENGSSKAHLHHPKKRTILSRNADECPDCAPCMDDRCTGGRAGRRADTVDCADCGGSSERA
jgi:hypothetical protein